VGLPLRGPCWKVSWSTWEPYKSSDSNINSEEEKYSEQVEEKAMELLGLLAVVCGDGSCLVLVLPKTATPYFSTSKEHSSPSKESFSSSSEASSPVDKVLVIPEHAVCRWEITVPGSSFKAPGYPDNENISIMTAVWSPHDPLELCCGLADGTAIIWNLDCKLLSAKTTGTKSVILQKTHLKNTDLRSMGGVKSGANNGNKSTEMVINDDDDDEMPLPLPLGVSLSDDLPLPLPLSPLSSKNQSNKSLNKNTSSTQSTNTNLNAPPAPTVKPTPSFLYPVPHPRTRFIDHHTDFTKAPRAAIKTVSYCPYNPSLLMTGGYDTYIKIWNVTSSFKPLFMKQCQLGWVLDVKWDPQGVGLYTGFSDESVVYFDALWAATKKDNHRRAIYKHGVRIRVYCEFCMSFHYLWLS
jgi:WD40 repeat protein